MLFLIMTHESLELILFLCDLNINISFFSRFMAFDVEICSALSYRSILNGVIKC